MVRYSRTRSKLRNRPGAFLFIHQSQTVKIEETRLLTAFFFPQQYDKLELKNRDLERTLKAVRAGTEAGALKVCISSLCYIGLDIALRLQQRRQCWERFKARLRFFIYKCFLSLIMCFARHVSCHVLSTFMYSAVMSGLQTSRLDWPRRLSAAAAAVSTT